MSYEELHSGTHRAGKDHRCELCRFTIAKGREYAQRVYKWEGDFHDEKLHPWCRAELELFFDDGRGDDGFDYSDVDDFIDELLRSYGYTPGADDPALCAEGGTDE